MMLLAGSLSGASGAVGEFPPSGGVLWDGGGVFLCTPVGKGAIAAATESNVDRRRWLISCWSSGSLQGLLIRESCRLGVFGGGCRRSCNSIRVFRLEVEYLISSSESDEGWLGPFLNGVRFLFLSLMLLVIPVCLGKLLGSYRKTMRVGESSHAHCVCNCSS